MKRVFRFAIIPLVLLITVLLYGYMNKKIEYDATAGNIEFIAEHFNGYGKLIDYYGEIDVKDISDVKLFVTDDDITIKFGKINLIWTLENFVTTDVQNALNKIHIQAFRDKTTGKIRVFYKGEEIERWVS